MRLVIISLIMLALVSCGTQKLPANRIDSDGDLVGIVTKLEFQKAPFSNWFDEAYSLYELDVETVERLKPFIKNLKIKAVMGTWCGDSRREVPHFYKLLDALDFDYNNLQMIAVNHDKEAPNNEQEGLNIRRVPTLIFYKNGKEINRFVEYPVETLEKDMLHILEDNSYKHSYFED